MNEWLKPVKKDRAYYQGCIFNLEKSIREGAASTNDEHRKNCERLIEIYRQELDKLS